MTIPVSIFLYCLALKGPALPPPDVRPLQDTMLHRGVTAHRGNSAEFVENTLPAFQSAIALQVDWVELDIHRTRDEKIVVNHDRTTGRTGDRDLSIAESTYEELQSVDIATGFRKKHGLSLAACPPQHMPLLEEVLPLFVNAGGVRLSIQPKADCVEEAIALIRRFGAAEVVGFNDGNLEYMSKVKALAPTVPVFWDRPADADIDRDIRIAREKGFEALVVHREGITPAVVRKVKAAGLEMGAWTVNEGQQMKNFLNIGVERIYTDNPRLLIRIQNELK
ncbi:MAG: glycerophosphodiester phosphodiesterase family protein [Solitalea sp.]